MKMEKKKIHTGLDVKYGNGKYFCTQPLSWGNLLLEYVGMCQAYAKFFECQLWNNIIISKSTHTTLHSEWKSEWTVYWRSYQHLLFGKLLKSISFSLIHCLHSCVCGVHVSWFVKSKIPLAKAKYNSFKKQHAPFFIQTEFKQLNIIT